MGLTMRSSVVVMNIQMLRLNGIETTQLIARSAPLYAKSGCPSTPRRMCKR